MSSTASDIITYIGVPLAVLGVLPILYTFVFGILTQRRIRAALVHHGHSPISTTRPHEGFTIRSSPMTSLIEVELPRYTIAALGRNDDDYWRTTAPTDSDSEHHALLDRAESTLSMIEEGRVRGFLRGGSWRAFHWKKLIVGRKLYRIQYEDELREPPAEIDFSELVHFLLDWGAVPDAMGWEKLKSGGLWTPSGTVLLKKPGGGGGGGGGSDDEAGKHADWVLRTSVPDDSDGILSLTIRWSTDMQDLAESRGTASLPPGWGRLSQPALLQASEKPEKETEKRDLTARIDEFKNANKTTIDSQSCRFRAEDNRIKHLLWERDHIETGFVCEPFGGRDSASSMLFACATAALLSKKQSHGGLWAFDMPSEARSFVRKETVPCGVLVVLELLADGDAPQWTTQSDAHPGSSASLRMSQLHHQRFQARIAAEKLEATMPPEQARVHRMNREAAMMRQNHQDMMDNIAARAEREERRVMDAISSPRFSNKAVAEACLVWLIEQGEVGKEWTVEQLAEAVLYLLAVDDGKTEHSEAKQVVNVLEEWMAWANAGGMKKQQFTLLQENKVAFCFAAALVALIHETSDANQGKAGADMLECLGLWRKVRLG